MPPVIKLKLYQNEITTKNQNKRLMHIDHTYSANNNL